MTLLKQTILRIARRTGASALCGMLTSGHLRILGYHGLWVTPGYQFGDCSFMAPEQFDARMAHLKGSGLDVLGLDDAIDRLADGTLSRPSVVITIDDGWVSTLTHMLPILERYRLPATLYATTWYSGSGLPVANMAVRYLKEASGRDIDVRALVAEIDGLPVDARLHRLRALGRTLGIDEAWLETRQFEIMSPAELRHAHDRGLDVQLHTHRHILVADEVDRLAAEVAENRAVLGAALDAKALTHFCYPCGSFHPAAPAILEACNIRSATLVEQGLNAPGSDPLMLRRLLDGRSIGEAEFDAYLTGLLHFLRLGRSASARVAALPGLASRRRRGLTHQPDRSATATYPRSLS
ncbi:polysaccharide deacetylase family protein [Sphingosinicella sp. BN140058]|uniref:polysaccharide deacetylase family protein n=1 Tax=Sphingosinicella sp. BN140058 TaxID=1892855 RepID=UPI0010131098|nr:polysaccharide deacetylase family protein [Sphingosinicella sp. BN140058]QAY75101.1 polysaccharide deacetylase family protein [Sphingosinicella sp. BN140058]